MIKNIKKYSNHQFYSNIENLLNINNNAIITMKDTSMLPFIKCNRDKIILYKEDFRDLNKGDIIFFKGRDNQYVIRRIYEVSDLGYLTMGDKNLTFDGWIRPKKVIGVVKTIIRNDKEIKCNSLFWKKFSLTWIKLLPIRKILLKIYKILNFIKKKMLTK